MIRRKANVSGMVLPKRAKGGGPFAAGGRTASDHARLAPR